MRVLPVLDLKNGCVVHARAGRRSDYQPLQSVWCEHASDPVALTNAFRDRFGVTEWYIADLDSLQGIGDQRELIDSLQVSGLRLWLDAGMRTVTQATRWLDTGLHRLVIASET